MTTDTHDRSISSGICGNVPMPSSDTAIVKKQLVEVLRSRAARMIHFYARDLKVDGKNYEAVLNLIDAPVSNKIELEVNSSALSDKAAAEWKPSPARIFIFPEDDYGTGGPQALLQRMTMVHEATHALHNTILTTGIDSISNEVTAYIAGASYYRFAGGKGTFPNAVHAAALRLVDKTIGANDYNGHKYTADELNELVTAIKGSYETHKSPTDNERTTEFADFLGEWEVKCRDRAGNALWEWVYNFQSKGKVTWHNRGDATTGGSGNWTASRADMTEIMEGLKKPGKIKIKWTGSGSEDHWAMPTLGAGSDGNTMEGKGWMSTGQYNLEGYRSSVYRR